MPPPLPRPTPAELSILNVLWALGPSRVREVHEALNAQAESDSRDDRTDRSDREPVKLTTALKLLQIMHQKGLVTRDESMRSHVYQAAQPQDATRGQLVRDLIDRAFSGSATDLAMRALSEKPASRDEIDSLRALLDRLEAER